MTFKHALTLAAAGSLFALFSAPALAGEHKYVGLKDCSRCHKKELMGDQTAAWKKAAHSRAFETLKGDEAIQIAKDRGLTTPPHETDDCLKCHATAHGVTAEMTAKKPLQLSDGVQCESCHGPGADYRKKKTMSDRDKSIAAGMWEPGKNEQICLTCHNDESPTWDPAGFDFAKAKKTIAHPIPEDVKGRYIELEKAARKNKGGANDANDDDDK